MIILRCTLVFLVLSACTKMVDTPKDLLSPQEMSAIIADFAIYDQAFSVKPDANMELASKYVLKKNNTTAQIYKESYKFYLSDPSEMTHILREAQEIILKKDPKLQDSIIKKNKEVLGTGHIYK